MPWKLAVGENRLVLPVTWPSMNPERGLALADLVQIILTHICEVYLSAIPCIVAFPLRHVTANWRAAAASTAWMIGS